MRQTTIHFLTRNMTTRTAEAIPLLNYQYQFETRSLHRTRPISSSTHPLEHTTNSSKDQRPSLLLHIPCPESTLTIKYVSQPPLANPAQNPKKKKRKEIAKPISKRRTLFCHPPSSEVGSNASPSQIPSHFNPPRLIRLVSTSPSPPPPSQLLLNGPDDSLRHGLCSRHHGHRARRNLLDGFSRRSSDVDVLPLDVVPCSASQDGNVVREVEDRGDESHADEKEEDGI